MTEYTEYPKVIHIGATTVTVKSADEEAKWRGGVVKSTAPVKSVSEPEPTPEPANAPEPNKPEPTKKTKTKKAK